MRGKTVSVVCACGCGKTRDVRVADRKRGWGKYFDKSCKARHQERRTGQYRNYLNRNETREWVGSPSFESGYFGHGQD